jgi:hypothetical protein
MRNRRLSVLKLWMTWASSVTGGTAGPGGVTLPEAKIVYGTYRHVKAAVDSRRAPR